SPVPVARSCDDGDESSRCPRAPRAPHMLADNAAAALEQADANDAGLLRSGVSPDDDAEILALQAAQGFAVELETLLILVVLLHGCAPLLLDLMSTARATAEPVDRRAVGTFDPAIDGTSGWRSAASRRQLSRGRGAIRGQARGEVDQHQSIPRRLDLGD